MIRLIHDLAYEPVLLFTAASAGLVAANEVIETPWLGVSTVVVVAVGGVVTRHYTRSRRSLGGRDGASDS